MVSVSQIKIRVLQDVTVLSAVAIFRSVKYATRHALYCQLRLLKDTENTSVAIHGT
jgi:hypothetical protein